MLKLRHFKKATKFEKNLKFWNLLSNVKKSENVLFFTFSENWTLVKFMYHEKGTNFCEISTVDLSYVVTVKSTVEIL